MTIIKAFSPVIVMADGLFYIERLRMRFLLVVLRLIGYAGAIAEQNDQFMAVLFVTVNLAAAGACDAKCSNPESMALIERRLRDE